MSTLSLLAELTGAELRSIHRDRLLRCLLPFMLIMGLLTRWSIGWISGRFQVDLIPYYPLINSVLVVLVGPVIVGYLVGVLLLDERDEGVLIAISVTPLPLWKYLAWKLSVPVIAASICTVALLLIVNLGEFRWSYLVTIASAALWAPLLALMMCCFARNKLQGFVLMRVSNIVLVLPMLAWFFARWEPLIALFPAYWPMKSFWVFAAGGNGIVYSLVGAVIHALAIACLYRRFQIVLGRTG